MTNIIENPKDDINPYQLLGQMQAVSAISNICDVTLLKQIQNIRKTKQFKGLQVFDGSGKSVTVTTFKDFCKFGLGRSYEQINEDLKNLEQFGGDAFEAFQRMGLGYRDLRNLRNLPEDEVLKIQDRVINSEDKSEIRDLIDELITEREDTKQELEKAEKKNTKLAAELETKSLEQEKLRDTLATKEATPWPELIMETREEAGLAAGLIVDSLDTLSRLTSQLTDKVGELSSGDTGITEYNAGIAAISLSIQKIGARLTQINNAAIDQGIPDLAESNLSLFSDDEVNNINARFAVAIGDRMNAEELRSARRKNAAKRGQRGRPFGKKA